MEPILVYGFPAGSSMGLVAALEWWGEPYRLCRVDMLGEMREPAYRKLNPRVETPALVTDRGQVLTETMAIAAWLAARDPGRRISFDPLTREADRMQQLIAFLNTGFTGAFTPLWTALEMDPPNPGIQSVLQDLGRAAVMERHDRLEEMLTESPFLVGDRPTLADAVLIGVARWLELHQVADRSGWPKLNAIRDRIEAQSAVLYALALEAGHEAAGGGTCRGQVVLAGVLASLPG